MQSSSVHDGDEPFSLFSIREKLRLVGGSMQVQSASTGTTVTLRVPRLVQFNRSTMGAAALSITQDGPQPSEARLLDEAPSIPPEQTDLPPDAIAEDISGDRRPRLIRVLLADDHEIVREGLTSLLNDQQDMQVVATACDGLTALRQARHLHPDVVVMDISMPVLSGIEATRQITAELPHVRVIGLSMHDKDDMAMAMRQAGACDYLSKGGPSEAVVAAIRHAALLPDADTHGPGGGI